MQIGVISDTHRDKKFVHRVRDIFSDMDIIVHLGDNVQDVSQIKKFYTRPVINVKGNCDFSVDVPGERIENIGGKKFFITHGHRYDVKYDLSRLKYKAMEENADVVLFGHTHLSKIIYENGIWFVNPGSPSIPRDGFNSVAVINLEGEIINAVIKGV
ncbi:metallophosphoesterase [Clostridium luticellarii]|uniref:Phosphoesterase n=1 Tax=Clostridium luticellarii TaxID=1691940 RepID=A0A2T0BSQ4_9CLOT|nr:metallophosphoesterase [Clostridium luticellarii]MCI1945601.1 metallophosphoesterase [Clostridium luticellarii]MCI1969387.1 metallophosphoesterase [Clostridium luticellarii]MCI1996447.1 metallophosphoesterase [Clostridium luticellarii]MCI2040800.1 metallophosphoesterase [Clostridium luticellarii]PRR86903.1 Phosphodiesterase YfcE [Clostridium luticellarii]